MQNKLGVDFLSCENIVRDLAVNEEGQQSMSYSRVRRESVTPKIVVCPPMEEMSEPIQTSRRERLLKAFSRRLQRRANNSDSMESTSSNESMFGKSGQSDSSLSASNSGSDCSERSQANDSDAVESSSSNDSMSGKQGRSGDHSSSTSDGSEGNRRTRSTVSLRRVFQSLSSRCQTRAPTERRPAKKQQEPQRILRSPVTYTYVRGLSGLPTQRVPCHPVCCTTVGFNR